MKRQLSLDLLRGIAVLLVIVCHCHVHEPILATIRRGGWIGVDLFFVLSGFLVAGLLFKQHAKEGRIRPINFLVRRAFKIYPAFWVFIAVTIASFFATHGTVPWSKLANELLFVQSYTENRLWGHTWSLAIEEHFYFLLPLILVPLAKVNFKPLPRLVLTTMAALLVAKILNAYSQPFRPQITFYTHLRIDALFFGVLLSYWHHTWTAFNTFCKKYSYVFLTVGCLMLLPCFIFDHEATPFIYSAGQTINSLAAGCILMALVCGEVADNSINRGLAWIGQYSYSIYLWHNFVIIGIVPMLGLDEHGAMFVYIALVGSVAMGAMMSRLVEEPALKLRDLLTHGCQAVPSNRTATPPTGPSYASTSTPASSNMVIA